MAARSHLRGHKVEFIDKQWIYSDNKQPVHKTYKDRPCGKCGKAETVKGHDACLGTLPGLMNACCGHGSEKESYVQFLDGFSVHGEDAIKIIEILKLWKNLK